jgi:hypothetical protein
MDRAAARLGRIADHLAEESSSYESRRQHTAAQISGTDSATIALPEKLSEDDQWRVHRCALLLALADKDTALPVQTLHEMCRPA